MSDQPAKPSCPATRSNFPYDLQKFVWPERIKLIVCATPRSATMFMSRFLNSAGIRTGHEAICGIRNAETRNQDVIAEVSWLAAPYLACPNYAMVLHLVRDPFRVIPSMMARGELEEGRSIYAGYANRLVPDIAAYDGIDRYLRFCLTWNERIERWAVKRCRIEDINANHGSFLHSLSSRLHISVDKSSLYDKQDTNASGCARMSVNDLAKATLADEFIYKASEYGYTL